MPQMRAVRTFDLRAPIDRVRRAVEAEFDTTPAQDVASRVDLQVSRIGGIDGDTYMAITLIDVDEHTTTVALSINSHMRIPFFGWAFHGLILGQLERRADHSATRLEAAVGGSAPPASLKAPLLLANVPFTQAQASMLASAAFAGTVASMGAALYGQNAQSIQKDLVFSDPALTTSLAITRSGALVALFVAALADRVGRRRMILVSLFGVALANALTAFVPNVYFLTAMQSLSRGFVSASFIVAGIAAVEEAPEGARAFAAAMLTMAGGMGFTLVVLMLPIADRAENGWRVAFLVSGLTAFFVPRIGRHMKDGDRFRRLAATAVERGRASEVVDRQYGKRFAVLAGVGFATAILSAPSGQLTNKYLVDERGFSNSGVSGFRAVTTGLPGFIGMVLAGRLSELRGRRPVAALFLALAGLCQIGFFTSSGFWLYAFSVLSVLAASCGGLAISTMGTELFPTEVRGTGSGMVLVVSVLGSAAGFTFTGLMSDSLGGIGPAIALCAIPTVLAAILLVPRLPEPAGKTLDEISPSEEQPDHA